MGKSTTTVSSCIKISNQTRFSFVKIYKICEIYCTIFYEKKLVNLLSMWYDTLIGQQETTEYAGFCRELPQFVPRWFPGRVYWNIWTS